MRKIFVCVFFTITCLAILNVNNSRNAKNEISLTKLLKLNVAGAEYDPYRHWQCAETGSFYDNCWIVVFPQYIPVQGCINSTIPWPAC